MILVSLFRTENLRVEQTGPTSAQLWLDVAGRSVNVLDRRVLSELDQALDRIAERADLRTLTVASAKSSFLVGADIQQFAAVSSADEAMELSAFGQRVFDKLANLRLTTIATIHGACLGGGLELALACDYRQAIDHPQTQLGFPEIELGLIPGWGGTQRLPRLIGLERALAMILTARRLDARQALAWGLLDQLARPGTEDRTDDGASAVTATVEFGPIEGKPVRKTTWRRWLTEGNFLGRAMLFQATRVQLRRRVPDDMPAPWEAIKAVRYGWSHGLERGLESERQACGRLAMTPACRNLVGLFLGREKMRQGTGAATCPLTPQVRRVGVVGAGAMGAGIAQLAAIKGFDVVVQEVSQPALTAGIKKVRELFDQAVERGILSGAQSTEALSRVVGTTAWEGFDRVDLVVEAALEDLPAKRALFRELAARTRPATVLATNTSSLSIASLQEGLLGPQRVAGLHFFNPVHKMPLVEVVAAPATSCETTALLTQWAVALGKTPVQVKDSPAFVVNRILVPYLEEAVLLFLEGIPIERVDRLMRRFGMPLGPLELLDQVGLDVAEHIVRALEPFLPPGSTRPPIFETMRTNGWLGRKSGRGFYYYARKKPRPNFKLRELLPDHGEPPSLEDARDRMVLRMCNEAAMCAEAHLTNSPEEIDLAMVLGTGWAPHRGGPLRYARDRGLAEVVGRLRVLAQAYGRRFDPCAGLCSMVDDGAIGRSTSRSSKG